MKFKEVIEQLPSETMVYVGFQDGSSWCWIEKAGYILDNFDKFEKRIKWYHEATLATKKRIKEQTSSAIKKYRARLKLILKTNKDIDYEDYDEDTQKKVDELYENLSIAESKNKKLRAGIGTETKILKNWVPLANREVVEIYGHTTDPGICIISKGTEKGDIWFIGDTTHEDKWKIEGE